MTDRYDIDSDNPIGHGAYGTVFRCRISQRFYEYLKRNQVPVPFECSKTLFAVKVQSYDALFWEQISLLRELDVLMRTKNYPGTVEVFDYWLSAETKQAFLILNLANGSLHQFVQHEADPLERIKILPFICAQLLLHVAYLKHNGIAHRDIKPQNILLERAPHIFGWCIDDAHIYKKGRPSNSGGSSGISSLQHDNNGNASEIDPQYFGTHHSIENVVLHTPPSVKSPIRQMCKFFLPVAHNCTCFTTSCEPDECAFKKPKLDVLSRQQQETHRSSTSRFKTRRETECAGANKRVNKGGKNGSGKTTVDGVSAKNFLRRLSGKFSRATAVSSSSHDMCCDGASANGGHQSKAIAIPTRADLTAPPPKSDSHLVGSAPAMHCYSGNADGGAQAWHLQPTTTICHQNAQCIRQQSKAVPLVSLCDFGLSKHMNKTHHSPYIVTPNYRSPELFDPLSFCEYRRHNSDGGGGSDMVDFDTFEPPTNSEEAHRQRRARLVSSLQLSDTGSPTSAISTDPNDVSIKREEDLQYTENIDVWGVGCSIAQLASGKTLFPGKNLQTVFSSLASLLGNAPYSNNDGGVASDSKSFYSSTEIDNPGAVGMFEDDIDKDRDSAAKNRDFKRAAATQRAPPPLRTSLSGSAGDNNVTTTGAVHWIHSVEARARRIRQRLFLHLLSKRSPNDNENVAQRTCDALGDEFFDLLAQMLDPNPHTRPSAEQLLAHDFVRPFVECSTVLVYSIGLDRLNGQNSFASLRANRASPQHVLGCLPARHSEHHWWAFQSGLRVGAFFKDQRRSLLHNDEWSDLLLHFRAIIFSWMFKVVRQTNCRYQTLFSALYNFDRCIANFSLNNVEETLSDFNNYKLLAACCIYLVIRYYERIYLPIDVLLSDLQLRLVEGQIERAMALFLDSVCGQLTLPSPWHFVLQSFKQLCHNRLSEFDSVDNFRLALRDVFARSGAAPSSSLATTTTTQQRLTKTGNRSVKPILRGGSSSKSSCNKNNNNNDHNSSSSNSSTSSRSRNSNSIVGGRRRRSRSAGNLPFLTHLQQQENAQRRLTLAENNRVLAEEMRRDVRTATHIYTSNFKKRCSRLLFFIMQAHKEPYCEHNNRALGHLVFQRRLFNALFMRSFDKLKLRRQYHHQTFANSNCSLSHSHTTTLVKAQRF